MNALSEGWYAGSRQSRFCTFGAIGLSAAADPAILERAAFEGRVLLTHDRQTIPGFAYARVDAGEPMPGVFLVSKKLPIGQAGR